MADKFNTLDKFKIIHTDIGPIDKYICFIVHLLIVLKNSWYYRNVLTVYSHFQAEKFMSQKTKKGVREKLIKLNVDLSINS